jgi:hypothetical protein
MPFHLPGSLQALHTTPTTAPAAPVTPAAPVELPLSRQHPVRPPAPPGQGCVTR